MAACCGPSAESAAASRRSSSRAARLRDTSSSPAQAPTLRRACAWPGHRAAAAQRGMRLHSQRRLALRPLAGDADSCASAGMRGGRRRQAHARAALAGAGRPAGAAAAPDGRAAARVARARLRPLLHAPVLAQLRAVHQIVEEARSGRFYAAGARPRAARARARARARTCARAWPGIVRGCRLCGRLGGARVRQPRRSAQQRRADHGVSALGVRLSQGAARVSAPLEPRAPLPRQTARSLLGSLLGSPPEGQGRRLALASAAMRGCSQKATGCFAPRSIRSRPARGRVRRASRPQAPRPPARPPHRAPR